MPSGLAALAFTSAQQDRGLRPECRGHLCSCLRICACIPGAAGALVVAASLLRGAQPDTAVHDRRSCWLLERNTGDPVDSAVCEAKQRKSTRFGPVETSEHTITFSLV